VQKGIDTAGQRINQVQTSYAQVCPNTRIVRIGNSDTVQVLGTDGQTQLMQFPRPSVSFGEKCNEDTPAATTSNLNAEASFALELLGFEPADGNRIDRPENVLAEEERNAGALSGVAQPEMFRYELVPGMPRRFLTERLPFEFEDVEEECADKFIISSKELLQGLKGNVNIRRVTLDVFMHQFQMELTDAALSPAEVALRAQAILCKSGFFSPRDLQAQLLNKLKQAFEREALREIANNVDSLERALNIILVGNPQLLFSAQREALAKYTEVVQSADLPTVIESSVPFRNSFRNIYGYIPADLNDWECRFADILDSDVDGHVKWWHRNEPRKPWSICVVLADGRNFFPDFVIGVEGRRTAESVLLADTKEAFEREKEILKSCAQHAEYGHVLIINLHGQGDAREWFTIRYDAQQNRAQRDRVFHTGLLKSF
jgi:hypothetical protein